MTQIIANIPVVYEPKKTDRYRVTFPQQLGIAEWLVQKVTRPSVSIQTVGEKIVPDWNEMTIVFNDPIAPSMTRILWEMLVALTQDTFDHGVDSMDLKEIIEKLNFIRNDFGFTLEMLDPTDLVVEKWEISGCAITSIDFGSLDYSTSSTVSCSMKLKPTNIKLIF